MIIAPEREGIMAPYHVSTRRVVRSGGHLFILNELRGIAETVRKAANPDFDHTLLKLELCMGEDWRGCGLGSGYSVLGTQRYRHLGRLDFSEYEQVYFIGNQPAKYKETCLQNRDHIEQVISSATPDDVRQVVRSLARFTGYDIRERL